MIQSFTCAFQEWSPGLGDNHLMGWLTVALYVASAWAVGVVAMRIGADSQAERRERLFWWIACLLLGALAINKQLDLQSLLTAVGRCHARLAGWYDDRRAVQVAFIVIVILVGIASVVGLGILLRQSLARTWLALLGLGFVALFVLVRATSFHHVDVLINRTAAGLRLNWLLEMPGPALVIVAAWRRVRARTLGPKANHD